MSQTQKKVLYIEESKVIKVLNKPFTKQILKAFSSTPLTASDIAEAISFPKDKIYYHIKKLLSLELLFVAETKKIKGIEQKKFFPVAKNFEIRKIQNNIKNTDIKNETNNYIEKQNIKNEPSIKKQVNKNLLNIKNRRVIIQRRIFSDRRVFNDIHFDNVNRRYRVQRKKIDRREINLIKRHEFKLVSHFKPKKSIKNISRLTNYNLQLNGISQAISFVQNGSQVIFTMVKLQLAGFEIKTVKNYSLPYKKNGIKVTSLPELIVNVYNQYFSKQKKGKIFLAIHSDLYQYEMIYLNSQKKIKHHFSDWLLKKLRNANVHDISKDIFDYIKYKRNNNSIVCFSKKNEQIKYDYNFLKKVGLTPRYNTSIPKVLLNIHNYYNLSIKGKISLVIYIDYNKTYLVCIYKRNLISSLNIPLGLNTFINVFNIQKSEQKIVNETNKNNAIHYLEKFGILLTDVDETIQTNKINKNKNNSINEIAEKIITEIKRFINELKLYKFSKNRYPSIVNSIYIGGVGSHIKNIDKKINISLEFEVDRIDRINLDSMKKYYESKRNIWIQTKEKSLLKRQNRFSSELEIIQKKILNHNNALEIAKSPESVKYRITRLEIDQNAKIRSIERQSKKLIKSAKEFKSLKDAFLKEQNSLSIDLDTVSNRLEDNSENLISKYKEYDFLMKKISEIEFESDNKNKVQKREVNEDYGVQIKDASSKRDKLNDQKETLEKESDDLQINILSYEEKIRELELKLASGYDDVAISEYLVNTIQNTAKAFERSLIVHLKSFDRLRKQDLSALNRIGYLLVQNTEKLEHIKNNYQNQGINDLEIFFDKSGDKEYALDVRKKIIPVIDLIIQTAGNLEQIKNYTSKLINLNTEQNELLIKKKNSSERLKKKELKKIEEEQKLSLLNNELELNLPILDLKKEKRLKVLNVLSSIRRLVHETKDIIKNIEIKNEQNNLIIENKDKVNIQLKTLKIDLENIKKIILENGDNLQKIKDNFIKNNNHYEKINLDLKPDIEKYEFKIDSVKEEIAENSNHEKGITKEIKNLVNRNKQLEKFKFERSEELKNLSIKKIPIIQEFEKRKRDLTIQLNIKQKDLNKNIELRIKKANKTKNVTIKSFFKKEINFLEKKRISLQVLLLKSTKNMEKVFKDKKKSKLLFDQKVKNKTPQILDLEEKIKNWKILLNQGKMIQKRLNELEQQKLDWEEYLEKQKSIRDLKIGDLNTNIKRKQKKSYLLFLTESLKKSEDKDEAGNLAKEIVEENISSDLELIEKLNNTFNGVKKRYQLFMTRYRKNHKKIVEELKPFGGQEKIIRRKINNANKKITEANRIIKSFENKLDIKNKILEEKEIEFIRFNTETQKQLDKIQNQINQIPQKQVSAKEEIAKKLKDELIQIKKEKNEAKEQYKINLIQLESEFQNNDIIIGINHLKDNLKNEKEEFLINEINYKKLNINLTNIKQTISRLLEEEKKYLDEYSKLKMNLSEEQSSFELKNKILEKELKNEENDLFNNQEKENKYNQKQRQLKLELIKLENDQKKILKQINQLKKKINIPFQKVDSLIDKNKLGINEKLNELERYKNLVQLEKDFTARISGFDNDIKELYKILDSIQNQESSYIKKLNILNEDISLLKKDNLKIENIMNSNRTNMDQIGVNHLKVLDKLEEVQDIYFPAKTMLNDRIDNIYNLIEKNKNEKNKLIDRLNELEKRLKTKRIESAEIDNKLSLINRNMKKILELSIDDNELDKDKNNNKEETQEKIQSYVDLVDMKSRTKQLFNDITETEKDISMLKGKKSSIKRIINDNEKINRKKIERLEEICSSLEKKIIIDKEDLSLLENKLKELNRNASTYGSRIGILEKELEEYKNKEEEYERKLKELNRSLKEIKNKAKNLSQSNVEIYHNTIETDYMINLGLLMDSKNQLNLIPKEDKKDYRFFKSNNILRNCFLVLTTVFTLATYAQKTQLDPLINLFPKKSSELTLLNMRQEMKKEIVEKNRLLKEYELLINKDKNISINMINALKYFTQVTPKRFKVTELKLDSDNQLKYDFLDISISIKGFYGLNKNEAEIAAKYFLDVLINSKKFKSVEFSSAEKINNWRTNFEINLVL